VRADPHLRSLGYFEPLETKEGTLRFPGVPTWFSKTPARIREAGPRLGEHTAQVLQESGFTAGEVEVLLASGAAIDGRQRTAGEPDAPGDRVER